MSKLIFNLINIFVVIHYAYLGGQTLPEYQNIDNIFILELSLDESKLVSKNEYKEFLLVRPIIFEVGLNNDILISDEMKIKLYSGNGDPKRILGRPGEGPGEYRGMPYPIIGPTGYIIVYDISPLDLCYYSLYSPEYKLIYTKKFIENQPIKDYIISKGLKKNPGLFVANITPLNETDKIYLISIIENNLNPYNDIHHYNIIYEKNKNINMNLAFNNISGLQGDGQILFDFKVIDENSLIYYTINECIFDKSKKSNYNIHIVRFDNQDNKKYTQQFIPNEIPINEKIESMKIKRIEEKIIQQYKNALSKQKYYFPVTRILADKEYIYIIQENRKIDGKVHMDIFDIKASKFLMPVLIPLDQKEIIKITNKYAYIGTLDSSGYPVLKKYKINPAVYKK